MFNCQRCSSHQTEKRNSKNCSHLVNQQTVEGPPSRGSDFLRADQQLSTRLFACSLCHLNYCFFPFFPLYTRSTESYQAEDRKLRPRFRRPGKPGLPSTGYQACRSVGCCLPGWAGKSVPWTSYRRRPRSTYQPCSGLLSSPLLWLTNTVHTLGAPIACISCDLACLASFSWFFFLAISGYPGSQVWPFIPKEDRADYYSWRCVFS